MYQRTCLSSDMALAQLKKKLFTNDSYPPYARDTPFKPIVTKLKKNIVAR